MNEIEQTATPESREDGGEQQGARELLLETASQIMR